MSSLENIFLIASLAGVTLTIIFAIFASISSRHNIITAVEEKSGSSSTASAPRSGLFLATKILTLLSLV